MAKTLGDMVHQYERNQYAFSDFLGMAEIDDFYRAVRDYDNLPYTLYGGRENCERLMLRIGSPETLGYDMPFPIAVVEMAPKNQKYADPLTHRDFLGAVLNLGLERDVIGDIYIENNVGYAFCTNSIAPFLVENLDRVKHTAITCTILDKMPPATEKQPEEKLIQAASLRLDLILAHTFNLSRNTAQELFTARRVFVNGRLCENESHLLQPGEIVSVRGYGRVELKEEHGLSRKGKHNITVAVSH